MTDDKYCQACESKLISFKVLSVTVLEAKAIRADKSKAKSYVPYFFGYACLDCAEKLGELKALLKIFKQLAPEELKGF
mgnify:CR=1 FL=1